MPLTRSSVTVASRVMLPVYVGFFASVGLSLLLTPVARLRQTPAFDYAAEVVALEAWGVGSLAVAATLVAGLAASSRRVFRAGLSVGFLWMLGWAVVCVVAAFEGSATFSAWTWPAFIAAACWATLRSLAAGER